MRYSRPVGPWTLYRCAVRSTLTALLTHAWNNREWRRFVFESWGNLYPQDRLGLGQHLIEPLAQGVPIFFGPHMNHWRKITRQLLSIYPGLEVRGAAEISSGLTHLSRRPDIVDRLSETSRELMARKQGSLEHHLAFLQEILKSAHP